MVSDLARNDPNLGDLSRFLSQAYNFKSIADYELGPDADVPLDRAAAAIDTAQQLVDRIAELAS